ncbi:hypothetical protein SISNIDRAFT_473838 [Sistotremastrum niveocremeum HHB9708]|uniref:DDE Tnp4 domain-containing protein n=1 Tax=Sistotremastrum niveocremeum HHB9708 TaxID=1314777 RepID=A0A164WAT5_9AGAM|nr:hypothetical protein SISNIDRAFT_473838 [Sistotremastrum niveocremeum HHB9708]
MSKISFWHLVESIKDDPVFQSKGKKPQRPAWYQLATFLVKWGEHGGVKTATVLSIAEGTVYLYQRRVTLAFRRIKHLHIWWPGAERRAYLKQEMAEYGFPGCIGMVDGTLFRLSDKPKKHGWSYWCRKKFYALTVQATCDHRAIFTSYDLGWPGCVNDAAVWKESCVWENRASYFAPDEYILADKGLVRCL